MHTLLFQIAGFLIASSGPSAAMDAGFPSLQDTSRTMEGADLAGSDSLVVESAGDPGQSSSRPSGDARIEGGTVEGRSRGLSRRRIEREELQRSASLPEALSRLPGVLVRSAGGVGGFSQVSMRGSSARQVEVWLDGIPLGGSTGSAVDLGIVALDGLERVEWSQATQAGVPRIELVSRHAFLQRGAALRAGSFGDRAVSAWWGAPSARMSANAWMERSDNDWPFPWDNGTRYNRSDDRLVRLQGNDYLGYGASTLWRPTEELQVALRAESSDKGISAPWIEEPSARWTRQAAQGSTRWGAEMGAWRGEAFLEGRRMFGAWADQGRSLGWESDLRTEEDAAMLRLRGRMVRDQRDWNGWSLELEGREEWSRRRSLGVDRVVSTPDGSRRSGAVELGWRGEESGHRFGGEAGFRRDFLRDEMDSERGLSRWVEGGFRRARAVDRSAARLWTRPLEPITVELSGVRYRRAPDFSEWMGDNGTGLPNPDLREEETTQGELGARWKRSSLELGVSGWVAGYRDPIGVVQRGSSPLTRHENLPGYLVRGAQMEAQWAGDRLSVRGNATWQKARVENSNPTLDGAEPRRVPRWKAFTSIGYGPWKGLRAGWTLDAQGESWANELQLPEDRLPGRLLHGLWARWTRGGFLLCGKLDNLTDEHPEDWADLPLSGRRYSLTIQWNTTPSLPGETR
ncbi:MAG: TonB-dependent receptor [Fibrobacteria bacterium]|nr:TonB-dependent receptor [Fibrobacteria bacterium]